MRQGPSRGPRLQRGERGPLRRGPLGGTREGRAVHRGAGGHRPPGGSRRARHLRELPPHRVPPPAERGLLHHERLPPLAGEVPGLPEPPAEPRRREAAGAGRVRHRLHPPRRGGAGRARGHAPRGGLPLRPLRAPASSPTPTSGSPAATPSPTGPSAWCAPTARRSRSSARWPRSTAATRGPRSRATRRSRWWCAATTAAAPSTAASSRCRRSTTRTTRSILVNDGSTDDVPEIAARYEPWLRVFHQENQGLSAARNVGMDLSEGEIIVYTDDDCFVDEDWLYYLVSRLLETRASGVGGPNLLPEEDGPVAACVSASPGTPAHILMDDTVAEHVPGCNMAFWADRLRHIKGFDPVYRAAGDDVDLCWRLQDQGDFIVYAPAAMVWHHRRATVQRLPEAAARLRHRGGAPEAQAPRQVPRLPQRPLLARAHLHPRRASAFRWASPPSTSAPSAAASSRPSTARPWSGGRSWWSPSSGGCSSWPCSASRSSSIPRWSS